VPSAARAARAAGALVGAASLGLALVLAGCATPAPRIASQPAATSEQQRPANWTGRLSLQVEGVPAQSFSALFDLRGTPERGSLALSTPIGSTLAELNWSPGEAVMKNGSETRRYESVEALILAATGAAIPVNALFGWLEGRDEQVAGWRADLQQVAAGRLRAVRESPLPRADLRIAFQQP
jgi:outer membrane lipoprotein LolB